METIITFYRMTPDGKAVKARVTWDTHERRSFASVVSVPLNHVETWLESFAGKVTVRIFSHIRLADLDHTPIKVEVVSPPAGLARRSQHPLEIYS